MVGEEVAPSWLDLATALLRGRGEQPEAAPAFQALQAVPADPGPLGDVARVCELDEVDAGVLAVLAAVEVDPEALQLALDTPSRTRSRPAVALLLDLFGSDGVRAVAPGAALDRCGLVEVEQGVPLLTAGVAAAREVVWRLLDEQPAASELHPDMQIVHCPAELAGGATRVLVSGADRHRRIQAAVTQTAGMLFYIGPAPESEQAWRTLTRRASLDGAGIVIELEAAPTAELRRWVTACAHLNWALTHRETIDLVALPAERWTDVVAAPADVTPAEWSAVFPASPIPDRKPTATQLQAAFVAGAGNSDAAQVMRRVASGSLLKHATRITPRVGWDELILPDTQLRRLHDLIDRYRYRGVVHDEWGLPLYPSPGVVTLFSGPSGTGKTTTAEVIAHELGVDMFRVDLSALVSKYIGETEKNLEEIFSAAHAGDYLLLFDEADSLFGTRSKVSDARDRYANMEVSYLLQRLETYDGFVVLTSNFQGNIDQAFLRRIHVTVHFAIPTAEDRARIWERSLGQAPRDDVDVPFVAEKFDLTGGSIRNAALTAAFYAAGGQRAVKMIDVLLAVTQEMIKLGRRPNDDQYGRWLAELKD